MKINVLLFALVLFTLLFTSAYAQRQYYLQGYAGITDDSLMFDGHFGKNAQNHSMDECPVTVQYVKGKNSAVKYVTKTILDCGGNIISHKLQVKDALGRGDTLYLGEEITTGDDGIIELGLQDGSFIRMAPNTTIKISKEYCESNSIYVEAGKIWSKVKKIIGGGKFEVTGYKGHCGVRGTEFTVEVTESSTTYAVYEGSVEFTPQADATMYNDDMDEMEKLQQDFQNGKISMEEYGRKIEEFSKNVEKTTNSFGKSYIIEAGNRITVSDNVYGPEAFERTSGNWFDDENFR